MGGKKEFNNMMDSVFVIPGKQGMESRGMIHEMREMQVMNMGQYAHGNQPIQHMVYSLQLFGRTLEGPALFVKSWTSSTRQAPTDIAVTKTTVRLLPGMSSRL